mmetsp:Transcript_2098/g.6245  ORF Transcript_2098/g.6245 Transcript_2098/m.6245 type:complete len:570 (+) Transcript_2098:163-1872(+)
MGVLGGFDQRKCKTQCQLCNGRIKLMRNKRNIQLKASRREVAGLLRAGKVENARIRVESVMREEAMLQAYDVVELFVELLMVRVAIVDRAKELPADMMEAITSLIYASSRVTDLPELAAIKTLLTSKFGKDYAYEAGDDQLAYKFSVNQNLQRWLSIDPPTPQDKIACLKEIAAEHEVPWDSEEAHQGTRSYLGGGTSTGTQAGGTYGQETAPSDYAASTPNDDGPSTGGVGPFDHRRGRGGGGGGGNGGVSTLTSLYDAAAPSRDSGAPPPKFYGVEAHERQQQHQQQVSLLQQQQQRLQHQGQAPVQEHKQVPQQWTRPRQQPSPPSQQQYQQNAASPHAPAPGVTNFTWGPDLTEESMYYNSDARQRPGGGNGGGGGGGNRADEEDGIVRYPTAGSRADGVVNYPTAGGMPHHSDSLDDINEYDAQSPDPVNLDRRPPPSLAITKGSGGSDELPPGLSPKPSRSSSAISSAAAWKARKEGSPSPHLPSAPPTRPLQSPPNSHAPSPTASQRHQQFWEPPVARKPSQVPRQPSPSPSAPPPAPPAERADSGGLSDDLMARFAALKRS